MLGGTGLGGRIGCAQMAAHGVHKIEARSLQLVPHSTSAAVLTQGAAFDQCPEMLLERVATGPGQFDGLANGDAAVLAGEFDDIRSVQSVSVVPDAILESCEYVA